MRYQVTYVQAATKQSRKRLIRFQIEATSWVQAIAQAEKYATERAGTELLVVRRLGRRRTD